MNRSNEIDSITQRHLAWRRGVSNLTYISIALESQAFGLGRVDCTLVEKDRLYIDTQPIAGASAAWQREIFDHRIQSYLWLLGAYELIRTLAQKLRETRELGTDDLRVSIAEVKVALARPRMLIAKHEPMNATSELDRAMTCLNMVFRSPDGIYFLSGPSCIDISRKRLADKGRHLLCMWPQELRDKFQIYPLGYLPAKAGETSAPATGAPPRR